MTPTQYTVAEIAEKVGATLHGSGETVATGVASLDAIYPGSIVFAERERDIPRALESEAAAVVAALVPDAVARPAVLQTGQVRRTFAQISQLFFPGYPKEAKGVHPSATVDPTATLGVDVAIGPHVSIGPGCVVGDRSTLRAGVVLDAGARIGSDCYLFPGAVLGHRCVLGDRCTLHPNAVIGAEGFGFTEGFDAALKMPQFGRVIIGDDCEIGACTTIDRGALDDTVLGDDVKLDNLIQVGHNCRFGSHIRVAGQTGFAGGVVVEDYCIIAGQVGVQNRVTIGRGSLIGGQSGVMRDVPPGSQFWGLPARNHRDALKEFVLIQRLPEVVGRLDALEARLKSAGDPEDSGKDDRDSVPD